jgi:hypothetical protein
MKIREGRIVVPTCLQRRRPAQCYVQRLMANISETVSMIVRKGLRGTLENGAERRLKPTLQAEARATRTESHRQRRDEFLQKLRDSAPEALKKIWTESERRGTDKITLREINSEIAAHRKR